MVEGSKNLLMELEFSTPWGAKGRRPSRPRVRCQISVSLGLRARQRRKMTAVQDAHGLFVLDASCRAETEEGRDWAGEGVPAAPAQSNGRVWVHSCEPAML